ncbi:NUDIX hydrolase domain-like protein [Cordyceps fumosorosea ARSEF 2679]|uniref:NUDIX hydrolase domain-like protein n=1 Tax=Cordyceps fumosorosea (strain ARSEF 2679) TaxID=1081104 RepID=A0A167Q5G7_CORFA|nr:NUDIX hydrolase domain-like protein [Cordyceps fumosorosea ARSEF 2679]OAA57311.1 NUDIX hydrolase domain-like protein [Cordyceps fumosorosea ARSEF 2679]
MSHVPFDPTVAEFDVSCDAWLATHQKDYAGVHASAVVFLDGPPTSPARILLVQRAATDSMPLKWELPGGAVDPPAADATILDGCARELREETGLMARRVLWRVTEGPAGEPLTVFTNSRGTKIFCKFAFEVEVESQEPIVLDPKEHQAWVWASEEEVVTGMVAATDGGDGLSIPLTAPHIRRITMEAFRLKKEHNAQQ